MRKGKKHAPLNPAYPKGLEPPQKRDKTHKTKAHTPFKMFIISWQWFVKQFLISVFLKKKIYICIFFKKKRDILEMKMSATLQIIYF